MKIKPSQNGKNSLSFNDDDKSCHNSDFLTWQICLNAICGNKILAKISEFTIFMLDMVAKS